MDKPSHHSLSRAGLSPEKNSTQCGRHRAHLLKDAFHEWTTRLNHLERFFLPETLAKIVQFKLLPKSLLDSVPEQIDLGCAQGTHEELMCAGLDHLDRFLQCLLSTQDHELGPGEAAGYARYLSLKSAVCAEIPVSQDEIYVDEEDLKRVRLVRRVIQKRDEHISVVHRRH